jgi:3',5'-cyclic AMP phosphodiesterase CpdA
MNRILLVAAGALLAAANAPPVLAAQRDQPSPHAMERSSGPVFSFGLVADVQYCDADPAMNRYYRASIEKLEQCVAELNSRRLAFTIQLGDLIDKDLASYDVVLPVLRKLKAPAYHVLGNHDYSVSDDKKTAAPALLGLRIAYYDFDWKGWRLIVLDGTEVSSYAAGGAERREAERILRRLQADGRPNAQSYNGGVGAKQLAWLRNRLEDAEQRGQKTIVFCHFPVFPENKHNLWNDDEIVGLLSSRRNAVACLCGHNHAGNYGQNNGVHYLTLPGLVETADQNAYAIADVYEDRIEIRGFGRVQDRTLRFHAPSGGGE